MNRSPVDQYIAAAMLCCLDTEHRPSPVLLSAPALDKILSRILINSYTATKIPY